MKAIISKSTAGGTICAPPSKSMAHRYLICAAFASGTSTIHNIEMSEDICATIDCIKALGANVETDGTDVRVTGTGINSFPDNAVLDCRESGSTLRFLIPIAMLSGKTIHFTGAQRLFERPLGVYEDMAEKHGFVFEKSGNSLTVNASLPRGQYTVDGSVSSQFISGILFALAILGGESRIDVTQPFESRPYVGLTVNALSDFGADVTFDKDTITVRSSKLSEKNVTVEGDCSNAAYLHAFNYIGGNVTVLGINDSTAQGDIVYRELFKKLRRESPTIDISDCPDLAPILFALAAMENGAVIDGIRRLRIKESDRAAAMKTELEKLGASVALFENRAVIDKRPLRQSAEPLSGHNDHRIVMALTAVLSRIGGKIDGAEAVAKSFPSYFDEIQKIGIKAVLE